MYPLVLLVDTTRIALQAGYDSEKARILQIQRVGRVYGGSGGGIRYCHLFKMLQLLLKLQLLLANLVMPEGHFLPSGPPQAGGELGI